MVEKADDILSSAWRKLLHDEQILIYSDLFRDFH